MKSKLKVVFMLCTLVLGMAVTAAAQGRYRTRDGRVYDDSRRVYRPSRNVVILPDGRRVYRNSRSRWGDDWRGRRNSRGRYDDRRYDNRRYDNRRYDNRRYNNRGYYNRSVYGARTYRLSNGRYVTVYPNGRRIYH